MNRRCWLLVVMLGAFSGCGMEMRKIQREEMIALESVTRMFPDFPHRVALATFEVMRAELASSEFGKDSEFKPGPRPKNPKAPLFKDGQPLPPNFPAFWVEFQSSGEKVSRLLRLGACHFVGKTRAGQDVTVDIQAQPEGTAITMHIENEDRAVTKQFLERVADRLAHPTNPPGSLEEAAALKSFFGGVESRNALPTLKKPAVASR